MHKQIELWPDPEEPQQTQEIWENLSHQQQKKVITALSRLISEILCLERTNQTREVKHEG